MLHNLKQCIRLQQTQICLKSTNKLAYRTIGNYSGGLVKCWSCDNEHNSKDIRFQCTGCKSLLDLPNEVVSEITYEICLFGDR